MHNRPCIRLSHTFTFVLEYHKESRLIGRNEAEQKRDEEAKKYTSNLCKLYQDLSNDMKSHLAEIKALTLEETNIKKS